MPLNIKNKDVEELAAEVASLARESMTQAVLISLRDRKAGLLRRKKRDQRLLATRDFLERDVWPGGQNEQPLTDDDLLGFGPNGA